MNNEVDDTMKLIKLLNDVNNTMKINEWGVKIDV